MNEPPRDGPCPACRYMTRAGRCRNRRCHRFRPADPETVSECLAAARAALTARKSYLTRTDQENSR